MKKFVFLLLILAICLMADQKDVQDIKWTNNVQVLITLPDGTNIPPGSTDNQPEGGGNADRASSGGWCTWAQDGLFFCTWISKVSPIYAVSDSFFPGDAIGYSHNFVNVLGRYLFGMSNFAAVGRASAAWEIATGDTLHIRLKYVAPGGEEYWWACDTQFVDIPPNPTFITAQLLAPADYSAAGHPEFLPCFLMGIENDKPSALPQVFEMAQNSPNPFNSATEIEYAIPSDADVSIDIFNIIGQKVKTLVSDHQSAGFYTVKWDGRDDSREIVPSGTYFYHIKAGEFEAKKRMLYIK